MSSSLMEALPPEILDEILTNCRESRETTDCAGSLRYPPKRDDQVLVLSQVSPYWRHFIHDNALLWSRLSLYPSSHPAITGPEYLAGLSQCITRASGLPLHLSIILRTNSIPFNVIQNVVKPYANQLEYLSAALTTEELTELFQLDTDLPRLKTLILVSSRVGDITPERHTTTFSALQEIAFGIPILSSIPLELIPWNRLTSFRLNTEQKADAYIQCLPLCTGLRHHKLVLDRDMITALLAAETQSIQLPSLESLEIEVAEEITESDVMNPFFTPALSHLELILRRNFTFTTFTNLIVRSGCTLKSLWLHAVSMSIHCEELVTGFTHLLDLRDIVLGCMADFPIHHLFTLFFPGRVTGPLLNVVSISRSILEARGRCGASAEEGRLNPQIVLYGPSRFFTGKGERWVEDFRNQGLDITYSDEGEYSKYSSLFQTSTGRSYSTL